MVPAANTSQAMEAGVKGHTSKDIKIIRTLEFSHAQMNDMCATCHAKLVPLSTDFIAGEKFYDHYDLITLEHQDFYPDGRDLGENYTFTSWSMSPCLKSGKLDCNHCHTPSGRPRFEGRQSNQSCLPCHAPIVENPTAHSHHKADSTGNSCIACHMPMSRFAAMGRTDHSMRPPTPAATIAYKSPNACNQCHTDHDAPWADQWVRKWYPRDYQAEPLRRAALLDAARKNDWQRLPEMLADVAEQAVRRDLPQLARAVAPRLRRSEEVAGADRRLERRFAAGAGQRRRRPGRLPHRRERCGAAPRHGRSRAAGADPRRGGLGPRASRADSPMPDARKSLRRATAEFKTGHGGPARRLGLLFEPGRLLHGKRRLRRGGRGLRDGP